MSGGDNMWVHLEATELEELSPHWPLSDALIAIFYMFIWQVINSFCANSQMNSLKRNSGSEIIPVHSNLNWNKWY